MSNIQLKSSSNLPKEMKSLYIVDYWVPFPSSEYGGVVSLIAENDTEAFEILSLRKKDLMIVIRV